ncbi:MAG: cytochrome c3 family protein [Desulfosarcinaceae bacterium]
MTSKKHRMIMYGLAAQLLLIAIVCYAAFPAKKPEVPVRIMFYTNAGKVLFNHELHTSPQGYALGCSDCHHAHPDGEEIAPFACNLCHPPRPENMQVPESCLDCHDASEIEDPDIMTFGDAMHMQCTQCHEAFGRGPLYQGFLSKEAKEELKTKPNPWVDCNKCHDLN